MNEPKFNYKVSVIIPIYNVEEYLRDCLDSLLKQTINMNDVEILLINDGSSDNSLNICKEYALFNSNIKLFTQENAGVSAARNIGIKNAQGRYIMFLDADDNYTPGTLEAVTNFFEKHDKEVNIVAYKRVEILNGQPTSDNYRYRYLKEAGIYSLKEYPFLCITTLSIAVKNMGEENILFNTKYNFGEDTDYIDRLLLKNDKIGYCPNGQYNYTMQRDGGAVNLSNFSSILQKIEQFENVLFESDAPSEYFQAVVFSDLNWLLRTNRLFPVHLSEEEKHDFDKRLKKIISRISDEIILTHPNCLDWHKSYWLRNWKDKEAAIISNKDKISIYLGNRCLYSQQDLDVIYHKVHIDKHKNEGYIYGFIKSKIFCYVDELPEFYAIINKKHEDRIHINVAESIFSFNNSRTKTNNFWNFKFKFDLSEVQTVQFVLMFDGFIYPSNQWFMATSVINPRENRSEIANNGYKIAYDKKIFYFEAISSDKTDEIRQKATLKFNNDKYLYTLRNKIEELKKQDEIWIYSDEVTVDVDNGYYQFIHDFEKNDNIKRYYILRKPYKDVSSWFEPKHLPYLVNFGSENHKILYGAARYVLSSFWDDQVISPFDKATEGKVKDLFEFDTIYLQHGILHAHLPLVYHSERCHADKIVISSNFEYENFVQNYGYQKEELIPCGMPRFDHISITQPSAKKIIFAPSWRSYFESRPQGETDWKLSVNKFLKSSYFNNIKNFLGDDKLITYLEQNDIVLDFKLHPIALNTKEHFEIKSNNIHILTEAVDLSEYSMFITDFSSYVFDYAYLKRPIAYFVPDMSEFKQGQNHYRELDLPFEKAFGNLLITPEEIRNEVIRIAQNNFVADSSFKNRMNDFYLPLNNCCEKLYKFLSNE